MMDKLFNFCFIAFLLGSISGLSLFKTKSTTNPSLILAWAKENGAFVSNLEFKTITKDNRYVVSTKDLKKGDLIASIPLNITISEENPNVNKTCQAIQEITKDPIEYSRFCIYYYLFNNINDPNSFFRPYFDTLPKDYPVIFSNKNLQNNKVVKQLVKGSKVEEYTIKETKELKHFIESIQKLPLTEQISNQDAATVYTISRTRAFEFNKRGKQTFFNVLLPVFDMLNHRSTNPNTQFIFDEDNQVINMIAEVDIRKGEELYFSYHNGKELSNSYFLSSYGFSSGDNRFSPMIELEDDIVLTLPIEFNVTSLKIGDDENLKGIQEKLERIQLKIIERLRKYLTTYEEDLRRFRDEKNGFMKDLLSAIIDEKQVLNENLYFVNQMLELVRNKKIERIEGRLKLLLFGSKSAVTIFEKVRNLITG